MAVACGGGGATGGASSTSIDAPAAVDDEAALATLPACGALPPAAPTEPVDGLSVPPGAVITKVREQGPLTQVELFVPLSPRRVRQHYEGLAGSDVLSSEDEIFEAELLLGLEGSRLFVKARATCATGSVAVVLVAAEQDVPLPKPAGTSSTVP